mgnify:CR=1 FL=1
MKLALMSVACLCGMAASPMVIAADVPVAGKAVSSEALRVVRDKQSGRLRAPTTEEIIEMNAAAPAATAAPAEIVVHTAADGTKSARLNEEYMMQLNAGVSGAGEVSLSHGETLHAQPATQPEEK